MRKIACENCRERKIKCEQIPGSEACANCAAAKQPCGGPQRTKKWVEKQQKKAMNGKNARKPAVGDWPAEGKLFVTTTPQQVVTTALVAAPAEAQLLTMPINVPFESQIDDASGNWLPAPIIPAQPLPFQPFPISPTTPVAGPPCFPRCTYPCEACNRQYEELLQSFQNQNLFNG